MHITGGNCPDAETVLTQHNFYRARHQAGALRWSPTLAADSTAYAQLLARQGCSLRHSYGRDYGENLMLVQQVPKPDDTCNLAVRSWYDEVQDYDFKAPQPFYDNWPKGIGHFTQLVSPPQTNSMRCAVRCARSLHWVLYHQAAVRTLNL
ncbi:hypothetical protein Vretimale_15488 [Volvox reticuliferus]|uniref:SCP domain-containing protein n=1 Tax=Volvox reticuliferus TaxID=1737510 RepID=A0A8J4GQT8_9CHLO|nr:hypothetical protein Vretimale_15488 [Volvox reticuliferus]